MSLQRLLGTAIVATGIFIAGYWAGSPKNIEKNYQNFDFISDLTIEPNIDLPQPIKSALGIHNNYLGTLNPSTPAQPVSVPLHSFH